LDASTLQDLNRIRADADAIGPERNLRGDCFDKYPFWYAPCEKHDVTYAAGGGYLSLEDLALGLGDKLKVRYDFGDMEEFALFIESVVKSKTTLPEIQVQENEFKVRARLVERGACKIFRQYDGECDY